MDAKQPFWILYACSVCGALMLWAKSTMQKKKMLGFADVAEKLFPRSPLAQFIFQFLSFVLFGGLVGLFFGGPNTVRQAFTAGVAWSRTASRD